jgi:hypothetical protein
MARKQRGGSVVGELVVFGIIFGVGFIITILPAILRVSALLLLFAFPLLVLLAYVYGSPSTIPAPPEAASEEENAEELRLKKAYKSVLASYSNRVAQGEHEGFRFTLGSGRKRFDGRSPRARQLNEQLEELSNERDSLQRQKDAPSQFRDVDLAKFKTWSSKASLRKGANVAMVVATCASVVLLAAQRANVLVLAFADDLLTRLHFPFDMILPFKAVAMGYFAAMIAYPSSKYILHKRGLLAAENYEQSLPTNDPPKDFIPIIKTFEGDPDDDVEDVLDKDEEFDEHVVEDEPIENEEWYQVLNVDPGATIKK